MKDDRVYLLHIINSLQRILDYTNGVELGIFLTDQKTQDACIRQFEVIGEATKRLSGTFREQFTQVKWRLLAQMRDKLIHDYIDVDLEIVWQTITNDVTPTLIEIEAIYYTLSQTRSNNQ